MAAEVDTIVDRVIEAAQTKNETLVSALIEAEVEARVGERLCDAITKMLVFIIDAKHPRMKADVAAMAAGMRIREGWEPVDLARQYGISRTMACTEIRKFCDMTGIPPQVSLKEETKSLGRVHKNTNKRNYKHKL